MPWTSCPTLLYPQSHNSALEFNANLKQTWLPLRQTCMSWKYWVCCNSELSASISRQWGRSCPVTGVQTTGPRANWVELSLSSHRETQQVEKRVCNGIPNQMLSSIFPSLFGSFVILFGSLTFVLCFVRLYKVSKYGGQQVWLWIIQCPVWRFAAAETCNAVSFLSKYFVR